MAVFFTRWLKGFSFGEAAYASQPVLSWQTTVIGDPLYRPFGQDPRKVARIADGAPQPIDRMVAFARGEFESGAWRVPGQTGGLFARGGRDGSERRVDGKAGRFV